MSAVHEEFRMVARTLFDAHGWQARLWLAECNSCGWVGPDRLHPLDCVPDSITHTRETGGAA